MIQTDINSGDEGYFQNDFEGSKIFNLLLLHATTVTLALKKIAS